jgi:hypothetical protein
VVIEAPTPTPTPQPTSYFYSNYPNHHPHHHSHHHHHHPHHPQTAQIYYDTLTGQYFYQKSHSAPTHAHVHATTTLGPNVQVPPANPHYYFTANQNRSASYINPNAAYYRAAYLANHLKNLSQQQQQQHQQQQQQAEEEEKSKPGGVIITEVSDDDESELQMDASEKKKEYVDAISLNGDEEEIIN